MRLVLLSMLLLLACAVALPAGAVSVGLEVDPLESSIGPRSGKLSKMGELDY